MNKSKFFTLIIIGLLISNGILFYMQTKEHIKRGGPKKFIINKLNFDEEQVKNYEIYIQHHRKAINANESKMNNLRMELYEQLKFQQDTAKVDSLISLISKQQYFAEKINYNHFLEIKHLCKPSQKKDFEALTNQIENLFSSKERK